MFGLLEQDLDYINKAIKKFVDIEQAKVFGSRAMGNYKKGSDVDIAIFGKNVNKKTVGRLSDLLNEEYPLPYFFDIVHYDSITNLQLTDHINNIGRVIYRK